MKNKNLSWAGALFVFALLLWCTAVTPGKVADPATYTCAVYSTFFSLLPPVIAIVLALNTKEVYTSLLVGIASGALLYANGNLELALNTLFFNEDGGMITKLSDSGNVGILAFLVMLGILVALMNKAGGSAAFGRWASTHIHSRAGAQFATLLLGVMIFVDDYFNCLTVGSVMRPVTDRQKVSRAKLAYLIDSTAAPICIIAPVSSWAAAVTSSVPAGSGINGFTMFLRTIPYNYYAVMTVVMSLFLIFTGAEFGPMKLNEDNAKNGDLFTTADRPYGDDVDDGNDTNGHVIDLIAPVLVLIAACIFGMVYTGGFFEGVDFITAFADCNASAGLVLGSSIALLFTFVFYRVRSVMTFQDFAACIPEGFKAMVSPMLILSLAWTLSGMTGLLGAKYYVANLLVLFMVEILNCMIRAFFKRKGWQIPEWIFFAGAVLIGMGGNFLAIMEYRTSWWLTVVRILYFAPFYAMGIFYKKILEKYVDRIPSVVYFVIVFAAKLMIFLHYKTRLAYTPAWCNDFNQGPVMPIIIGFLGIALWMRIATIMEPVFGRKKWINLLADNTFSIMENQFLGFLLVKVAFGTIANGTKLFLKFDWSRCKSDIWWYYMPKDVEQTKILYLLAAIFVALLIQWILTQVKKMGKNIFLYVRQ